MAPTSSASISCTTVSASEAITSAARRRCKQLQQDYAVGKVPLDELIQRLQSCEAHLLHGNTQNLRRDIFNNLVFRKDESAAKNEKSDHVHSA